MHIVVYFQILYNQKNRTSRVSNTKNHNTLSIPPIILSYTLSARLRLAATSTPSAGSHFVPGVTFWKTTLWFSSQSPHAVPSGEQTDFPGVGHVPSEEPGAEAGTGAAVLGLGGGGGGAGAVGAGGGGGGAAVVLG